MLSGWETYKGKKYFFCRYNNLTLDQLKTEIVEVEAEMTKQPEDSILVVVDVNGTIIVPATFEALQNNVNKVKKNIHSAAVLGVTGARRTMLELLIKITGLPIIGFDRQEDALEWLVNTGK